VERWPGDRGRLAGGCPYLDVAAEIEAVADTFAGYDEAATGAGVVIVPAMAFYGGLGDLLATAAVGDWPGADEISTGSSTSFTCPGGRHRSGSRPCASTGSPLAYPWPSTW
jgi:hypothetical protein